MDTCDSLHAPFAEDKVKACPVGARDIKVLLITKTLAEFPAEAGKVREMSKLGVDVSVVIPRCWRGLPLDTVGLVADGYRMFLRDCWFGNRKSRQIRHHLHFYPEISEVIRSDAWDIIHIDEEPMNLATYLVLRECRKQNRPAIFTTWQNLMKRYPPPFNLFERYAFKNAAGAIAGNREAMEIMRERGFEKPATCAPQHGVDPTHFQRQDASDLRELIKMSAIFAVGYVGQFRPNKGLDILLKALALLPKRCGLVLVGSGPDELKLRSLAQELGVSPRVCWRPWVDQKEVIKFMCLVDVLVLPSRAVWNVKEQFGRVLIEAMSCETPVVGSDSGEIPNVIGDAGLIFHEGNAQELAGHLLRLLENPSLRAELGRRGRERVLERFTYAKVAAQTVEFYKRICNGNH